MSGEQRKKEAGCGFGWGKKFEKKRKGEQEVGVKACFWRDSRRDAARGINMHFVSLRTELWSRFPRPLGTSRVSHHGSAGVTVSG